MSKNPKADAKSAKDLLAGILHSPALVKREWLEERQWTAVPIEQHGYVSRCELERLLHAFKVFRLDTGLIIYPSDPNADPRMKSFRLSLDALEEVARVGAFSYLITTSACEFLYHKTNEDFTLIAGPRSFVELAIAASIEAGMWDWRQFCRHPGWSDAERSVYEDVANWYEVRQ